MDDSTVAVITIYLAVAFLCGLASATLAPDARGMRSWFAMGFLLGPIGLMFAWFATRPHKPTGPQAR